MSSSPDSTDAQNEHYVQIEYWQPRGVQKCIAFSGRSFVGLMEEGLTVLKYPHFKSRDAMQDLHEEAARYHRLGRHENLVVLKAITEDGLLFEFCERGPLLDVIPTLSDVQKTTIAKQIILCLIHLHERNFIHCDLNVNNIFITAETHARVGDIQGQLYRSDGSIEIATMSQENAKSRHPFAGEDEFSVRTDIFALGTLLYHVWYGQPPFPDLDEHMHEQIIQEKYRAGDYPIDVANAIGMEKIIGKCWNSRYENANHVLDDMVELYPAGIKSSLMEA
ncbi:Hypothetical protein R9X50_00005300 [Acrodontium crateriforme]|uniref:Protein kinase domain-containing protein n=1 Tax=Acrodontium crateriforme TaxID=150365 RepID=A0AAQ3LWS0_9PEZI|nr:Hypothetical protein R9X50_00005300 [Acrodontium crateriforme]